MKLRTIAALLALASATPVLAQSVEAYDDGWYRAPFWSGEYPGGFSVLKDTTVQLRPALDPAADKSVTCDLPAKATYQAWNQARVEAQGLSFVSFTRIANYKITKRLETSLYRHADAVEEKVTLEPGDTWRYFVYFAEGAFLMDYEGVEYDGNQDLFEVSEIVGAEPDGTYDEWLRINCPNNQWGWLFMGDIAIDDVTFAGPNVTGYGEAKDLD